MTCFFIDTAHNVLRYLEVIQHVLRLGGYWVNLGPLLYHWADAHTYLPVRGKDRGRGQGRPGQGKRASRTVTWPLHLPASILCPAMAHPSVPRGNNITHFHEARSPNEAACSTRSFRALLATAQDKVGRRCARHIIKSCATTWTMHCQQPGDASSALVVPV